MYLYDLISLSRFQESGPAVMMGGGAPEAVPSSYQFYRHKSFIWQAGEKNFGFEIGVLQKETYFREKHTHTHFKTGLLNLWGLAKMASLTSTMCILVLNL